MTNKETILKTIQYIEANLKSNIGVIDIAREGCYSLYHFIRLFTSITGLSPNKYLSQRRLSEAFRELQETDNSIGDIAYGYQFGSPEAFTRAFRKCFGVNPSQVKNGNHPSMLNLTPPITENYLYQSENVKNQKPDLLELDTKFLAGISFFINDGSNLASLSKEWGQFMCEMELLSERIIPERLYQVQYWSENQDFGGFYIYIGAEVEQIDTLPPQFVVKVIPKGLYLRFIHKGLANKVGHTYQYIYNKFLPETNYKLPKPFNFEFYGKKCLGPNNENSESEIYIPVEL